MRILQNRLSVPAAVLTGLLLLSCASSTTNISSWKDQTVPFAPYRKVVVASKLEPLAMRQLIENSVVEEFKARGVDAVASLDIMPPQSGRDSVMICMTNASAEGVMVIAPLDSADIVQYVPERTTVTRPWPYRYRSYLDYWGTTEYVTEGGYDQKIGDLVVRQITFWDCGKDRLVWQGESTTNEYADPSPAIRTFARTLVDQLIDEQIVAVTSRAQRN